MFAFEFVVTVCKRDDWNICDNIADNAVTGEEENRRSSDFLSLMFLTKGITARLFGFQSPNH